MVLVDADRVVAALFVELHLPEVLVVDRPAEGRIVEPVRVRVVRRLREVRPGHQIERIDLHAHLPASDDIRLAGMTSRLQAQKPAPNLTSPTCLSARGRRAWP